jgi:hypothetical protein
MDFPARLELLVPLKNSANYNDGAPYHFQPIDSGSLLFCLGSSEVLLGPLFLIAHV